MYNVSLMAIRSLARWVETDRKRQAAGQRQMPAIDPLQPFEAQIKLPDTRRSACVRVTGSCRGKVDCPPRA